MKPYGSTEAYKEADLAGNIPITIREPSKGGIGIKLKTPNITFINIRFSHMDDQNDPEGNNFHRTLKANAKIRFANGPLAPTHIISLLGFLKAR